ncbi:hypothetical protein ACLI4Z_08295 [Natrialbaceae archaeon A-arb3/5]
MTDLDRLDQRLTAVERTVIDGEFDLEELTERATLANDIDRLESRLEECEQRLADVEGRTASIGGFVGQVETVNETVEQDAATALAVADRLEKRLDELERRLDSETDEVATDRGPSDTETRSAPADDLVNQRSRATDAHTAEETIDELVTESTAERAVLAERAADHTHETDEVEPATQHTVERQLTSSDHDTVSENATEQATDSRRSTSFLDSIRSTFR